MKLKCLQCDHEFDGTISKDDLGWHSTCPECGGSFDVDVPDGRLVMAFTDKIDGDEPYKYFTDEFTGEYIWEYFAFDTVEDFIKAWRAYIDDDDACYGMWYWVMDNGRAITWGACDPGDIEIFEDWFGELPEIEEANASEESPATPATKKPIYERAYEKYQLHWMMTHGYTVNDLLWYAQEWAQRLDEDGDCPQDYPVEEELEESGFNGTLWVCYDEFIGAEYMDAAYMKQLLNEKEFAEYLEDIGRLRICREKDSPEDGKPYIQWWSASDGTLYRPSDDEEIRPDQLPEKLRWLNACGFCGNNLYLCSYGDCYGVAVVYEYHETEAQDRNITMNELFNCAVADAVQMASCEEAKSVQIVVGEHSGELLGSHEVIAFIPAEVPADQIRANIQALDCHAFKASYLNGMLHIGGISAATKKVSAVTPAGAITAYKVGGNEYPGIAVDFLPNGKNDGPSVVVEYADGTVKARIHRDSNSEPVLTFNMSQEDR